MIYIPHHIADLYSTYAFVSEPVHEGKIWHGNSLIWETSTPYMYFRVTDDNRILGGGKDDPFYNPEKRDARVKMKAKALLQSFNKKFPHIPIRIDFSWAGTFAATADGLPYIGSLPGKPNTFFTLGFGGNGITFSVIGAQMIRDAILEKKNDNAALFSFSR
ncbi:MAG: FAD-binding oxidoreductase [Taibaiella sp.]|nr:FAD-binding oxidoreductase [Taibaiella sp.]